MVMIAERKWTKKISETICFFVDGLPLDEVNARVLCPKTWHLHFVSEAGGTSGIGILI
jgi:hypothetical protein